MHEQARTIYFSLRGRSRERFLETFARLNGDAAAREIEPGYKLAGLALGVRGAICFGQAPGAAPTVSQLGGKEARSGGAAGLGSRDQAPIRGGQGNEAACLGPDRMG